MMHTPLGNALSKTGQPLLALLVNRLDSPFFASLAKRSSEMVMQHGYTLVIRESTVLQ